MLILLLNILDCFPRQPILGQVLLKPLDPFGAHEKGRECNNKHLFMNSIQYGVHFSFLRLSKVTLIYRSITESQAPPTLKGTGRQLGSRRRMAGTGGLIPWCLLTTLGLNGGSISFFSSSSQLISRNKGCWRMSPLTPSLFSGSLTKS